MMPDFPINIRISPQAGVAVINLPPSSHGWIINFSKGFDWMVTIFVSLLLFSSSGCLSTRAFTHFTSLIQVFFSSVKSASFLDM